MSYLIAAYAIVLGSLAAYALSLLRRRRALLAAEEVNGRLPAGCAGRSER